MNILPFQLATTNDLLTSRAGLVCVAELMKSLNFSNLVDTHFPVPGSNRGFKPSAFVNSLVLMLHDGGECLDDLRHLRDDSALRELLSLKHVPQADSAGDWLRRLGQQGVLAVVEINRTVLSASLHKCQEVTLDIDATEICSAKRDAKYTYNKNQGFMPMVGHIAETAMPRRFTQFARDVWQLQPRLKRRAGKRQHSVYRTMPASLSQRRQHHTPAY